MTSFMAAKQIWRAGLGLAGVVLLSAGTAGAQVPPDLKAKIAAIGKVVAPPATAALYRPLQASAPYAGVTFTRDIAYGPDPRNILDVFQPAKAGAGRPVLIYVAGGAGNKIEPGPGGEAFYDNIMVWAVKNGMVGVNVQRQAGFGGPWDTNAKDLAAAIDWVRKNAAKYGGDPNRVFIWAHSAANNGLSIYLSHPEYFPAGGVGVKGAIMSSGVPNIAPLKPEHTNIPFALGPGGPPGGPGAGGPPAGGPRPGGPGPGGPVDPAVQLQHSTLAGLKTSKTPLFLMAAELDPPVMTETVDLLADALNKAGRHPKVLIVKDHGHMSEVFSVNTADTSVSGPVLQWIRSIK